ncbi:hypothetical protein HDU76_014053 [Blyttiomyces sp. JEL0837]|nr:hypothetical protein HDU76_014053 [Blyttiomyces sp. JEL0837]
MASTPSFGHGSFYYQSLETDGQSFIASRPFHAVYTTAATSVTWSTSSNCTISPSASSKDVYITCTEPAVEPITVYRNGDATTSDTFYVTVTKPDGCFEWHLATGSPGWESQYSNLVVPLGTNLHARLWVVDPLRLSTHEADGSAASPGDVSAQLTQGFYSIGQTPIVQAQYTPEISFSSVVYNDTGKFWDFYYNISSANSIPIVIGGTDVAIMDCVIENTEILLNAQRHSSASWLTSASLQTSTSTTPYFSIFRDACAKNLAFATSSTFGDGVLAMSQSFFVKPYETTLVNLLGVSNVHILDIATTTLGLTILTQNGIYFVNETSQAISTPSGLTASLGLTNLESLSYCDSSNIEPSTIGIHVVAWSNVAVSSAPVFYHSVDGGKSFTSVSMANVLSAGQIRDAVVQPIYNNYCFLVRDSTGTDKIVMYYPDEGVFQSGYVFSATVATSPLVDAGQKGSTPQITAPAQGGGEILVWGDALYYSPNGGMNIFQVNLLSRNPQLPAAGLTNTEYIAQVATASHSGAFAVLTSTNRVFYGSLGLSDAMEVAAGLLSGQLASLAFDEFDRLTVFMPSNGTGGSYVSSRIVSISNEVASPRPPIAANPTLTCPYLTWNVTLQTAYTLDIDESINFTATLTPLFGYSNKITTMFSNYSLITVSTNSTEYSAVDPYSNWDPILTRQQITSITPKSHLLSGITEIKVRPLTANLACLDSEHVSLLRVGCPRSRTMVFRGPNHLEPAHTLPTPDCNAAPQTVTLPAGLWTSDFATWSRPSYDKVVNYNCTQYGVPLQVFYGSTFVPAFDIYDGTTFVKTVEADIGIWEENGRNTFDYNMTAVQAGCHIASQSWFTAFASVGGNPINAWGPWDAKTSYPIFNATNYLGIVWKGGQGGIYMFKARVLDPDYSYCTLTAEFSLNVYGAPLALGTQIGIVLGSISVVLLCLAISYVWYLQARRKEAKEKEEEDERERVEAEREAVDEDVLLWKDKME